MNNENKLDGIGVQLQNESLTISFVSKFCLGCRLYIIDHAITRSLMHARISAVQEIVNGCRVGGIL